MNSCIQIKPSSFWWTNSSETVAVADFWCRYGVDQKKRPAPRNWKIKQSLLVSH